MGPWLRSGMPMTSMCIRRPTGRLDCLRRLC